MVIVLTYTSLRVMTSSCVVGYTKVLRSHAFSNHRQGSARNERNELSSSEPRYSDTDSYSYSTSPADDRNSRTRPQTSAIQTKYFPLRSAADNRPLSVYDNVTSTFTESEDDLTNDVTYNYNDVTLPHRIATSDEGDTSHFENRMEVVFLFFRQ